MEKLWMIGIIMFMVLIATAQERPEIEVETFTEAVTIYIKGAQITREGRAQIPSGQSKVTIKGLTAYLDPNSIQISTPNVSIQSVSYELKQTDLSLTTQRIDSIQDLISGLLDTIELRRVQLAVINQKEKLIMQNQQLGSQKQGPQSAELISVMKVYDEYLLAAKTEHYVIMQEIQDIRSDIRLLNQGILYERNNGHLPTSEIILELKSDHSLPAEFTISYFTEKAGWLPKYDIRALTVADPIELTYKAHVYQQTGEDWDNVELTCSSGNPTSNGLAPRLQPWKLNYADNTLLFNLQQIRSNQIQGQVTDEQGEALIGANVVVSGSTIGTITDINGMYMLTVPSNGQQLEFNYTGYQMQTVYAQPNQSRLDVVMKAGTQLDEIIESRYSVPNSYTINGQDFRKQRKEMNQIIIRENQTSINFKLKDGYDIPSNAQGKTIDLVRHSVDAIYQYTIIPKLDKSAYLIAQLTNWNQYNLLSGEASIYFEHTYIGKSLIQSNNLSDTLPISLGADRSVYIERERIEDYNQKQFIGNKRIKLVGHQIRIRNNKSQSINIKVLDQVPVSVESDISVDVQEISKGHLNNKTGIIRWSTTLSPKQKQEWEVKYEVKYPKKRDVYLE